MQASLKSSPEKSLEEEIETKFDVIKKCCIKNLCSQYGSTQDKYLMIIKEPNLQKLALGQLTWWALLKVHNNRYTVHACSHGYIST